MLGTTIGSGQAGRRGREPGANNGTGSRTGSRAYMNGNGGGYNNGCSNGYSNSGYNNGYSNVQSSGANSNNGGEQANRNGPVLFSTLVFVIAFAVSLLIMLYMLQQSQINVLALAIALIIALLATSCLRVAQQWEKVVVLRLGRFSRVAGPGLYLTIPVLESAALRVEMRVRTTTFGAEETLSADLVPLNVDAVLFWMVWDAKLACTEVGNFACAVELAAQTALRNAIGRAGVAEVAIRRTQLDKELRTVLEEKIAPWGITVLSVEVRDILVPGSLQEVMSLEAQAEQRKKARIILMEAEQDIAEMMTQMGDTYAEHDFALRLRMMHLLYESVRETGGTIVIPSSFSEGFKDILPDDLSRLENLTKP